MKTRCYILLWVLLTGLGTALWMGCVWPVIDDLAYLHRVVEPDYWAVGGGLIESGADLWQSITGHYQMVNSRLANLLALAVLQLPRWLQAAACGVAAAAMIAGLIALGGPRRRATAPVAALLMWIALPWHDGLASVDFEINYVWASALALWVLVAATEMRRGGAAFAAAMGAALAAGWMHEGIAAVMVVYLGCLWWRGAASRRVAGWLLAAAVAGFAVNLAGATTARAVTALDTGGGPDLNQWLRTAGVQMWPLWLAAAGAIVLRKRIDVAQLVPGFAAAAAGLAMCAVLRATGRAAWGVQLAAITVLLMELQCAPQAGRRLRAAAMWCAPALYVLWLGHLAAWQTRISGEEREMAQQAAAGADTLRLDLTPQQDIPFTLMGIVQHPPLMNRDFNSVFARHYTGRDGIAAVPATSTGKVPGCNPFYSCGWEMLSGDAQLPDTISLSITYGAPGPSATLPDRLAALLTGRYHEYTTEAMAVRGHAPGIYFIESAGRFSRGRPIIKANINP